ncbi:MAG: tRNA (N(6)-L-threonylcarbamoyladenosine(37)-C(2))-methylthiotransferase MtaB [Gammaproteobacteria bacterium]|nr:tRNA (N(6)-L-threonylcarbamoyladenosine(37)-C(2))-methylthiotransferase MtaB [Gammaproteobacteria bacterium]
MKVNFQALGCRLNEAELESWSSEFIQKGYQLTLDSSDADLVVFNSCSVTAEADRKSRKLINRIHNANPQSKLVVTGCYASLQPDLIKKQLGVDLVISNLQKDKLVDLVESNFNISGSSAQIDKSSSIFARGRHRAFIKIQDGCRYRCTFCIVTVARGEERSRLQQDIIQEINRHHQQGVQEIVITGVHVGGYGSDTGSNLYELLSEIMDKTSVPRIRLASVEPWDLPDNFFELFKDKRLMPHMHLPLQSGADSVLRRMARRCKTAEFTRIVEKARTAIPLFNITTDIIVGFPGETEKEWEESLKFVEQTGFGHMHIFSYSKREGTKAARLPDQIEKNIKKERSLQIRELAEILKLNELSKHIGRKDTVLWENRISSNTPILNGYTSFYHKIYSQSGSRKIQQIESVGIRSINKEQLVLLQQPEITVALT